MKRNRESGFTLIEMLIVLMIITVLIILLIPNLSTRSKDVHSRGCDALVNTVQGQVQAYQLDKGSLPSSLQALTTANYIEEKQKTCPSGEKLLYDETTGKVSVK